MRNCKNWLPQYIIYISFYKVKKYNYKITGYNKEEKKFCVYIVTKCANYEKNHIANFL